MKQKVFALITALCMAATTLPAVFADGGESGELTIGNERAGAMLLRCPLHRRQHKS